MKILFSPIGTTDPISNNRDGAMLHICRLYRPDKVILYLSKEMCFYHDIDDRYCESIRLLEKELGWQCEIDVIRDEEMENVQIFDAFINIFEKNIENIRNIYKPDEILVNVSSGTPAMKSSLQMISMLWNDIMAIQVSTPRKASNNRHEDKDDYDLEIQWECNEDRNPNFENRCMVSDAKKLFDRIKKENIQKYIEAYDYEAAKMMAETLSVRPEQEFWDGINIAINRRLLNLDYINKARKTCHLEHWFPIKQNREMKEYEYLLAMQTKLWKKQYGDFIKDLTPIFFSLSEKALKKYGKLSFKDIGYKDDKGVWKLNKTKLIYLKIHTKHDLKDRTFISSLNILEILDALCIKQDVADLLHRIRDVEGEVRNLAAHQIVGVTEAWIKRKTKMEPEEIMNMLFQLAEYVDLHISKDNRDIYNQMNQELIRML